MILKIFEEMNLKNSSNYKKEVVKKHLDNKLFQRVVNMALDKVKYTYGITLKNITFETPKNNISLTEALDILENEFCSRLVTGNKAIARLNEIFENLNERDVEVLKRVINRDLKVNFGKTQFNKFLEKEYQITKPPYCRCEIATKTNIKKNIDFNKTIYSQIKMDGTYRSYINGIFMSRTGNEDEFTYIHNQLKTLDIDDYVLLGEITLKNETDRRKGNGIVNSIDEREKYQKDFIYTVWDMIPYKEYKMSKDELKKAKDLSLYKERFEKLKNIILNSDLPNVKLVEYRIIKNMEEAYKHFQEVTNKGMEGTVIKTEDLVWKDGNSKQQLKCKLVFEIDARITGFVEGKPGTKREKTFGSIKYATDDGLIVGSVSGFTDKQLEEFNSNREALIGRIIEIEANDLTQNRNSDTYALSHPRFIGLREKDTTDTLERAKESLQRAMNG